MKARMIYVLLIGLQVFFASSAQGSEMGGNEKKQSLMDAIASMLVNRDIGRVEILQIPPNVLTRARITPEMLERQFDYKLIIRDMRGGEYREELAEAVKSTSIEPQSEVPDLRWGMIFYDPNGNRVGAIYFDKWGKNGVVGDIPVSFKGDLFKWLNKSFGKCFR